MERNDHVEIRVTRREYSALMDIRGLEPRAHMLVMCAGRQLDGSHVLSGTNDAFDALERDLAEEIGEGLAPAKNIPALQRVLDRITPEYEEDGDYAIDQP